MSTNIKVRDKSLTNEQKDIVIGLLLSDGFLTRIVNKYNNSAFSLSQKLDRQEFVDWVDLKLVPFVSRKEISEYIRPKHDENGKMYVDKTSTDKIKKIAVYTYRHPDFTELRMQWYPNGIKIVPNNFKLTPLVLAMWYIGDGQNVPTRNSVVFHTQGFTEQDCDFLISKLEKELGILSIRSHEKGKPIIRIRTNSYLKFIDIVKPYVIWECFKYKIKIQKYDENKWTFEEIEIIKKFANSKNDKELQKLLPLHLVEDIKDKRKNLGFIKNKFWSNEEIEIIKNNPNLSVKKLTSLIDRSYISIIKKIEKLNLRQVKTKNNWTDEEINILKQKGQHLFSTELQVLLPRHNERSISGKCHKLKIYKTKECRIRQSLQARLNQLNSGVKHVN